MRSTARLGLAVLLVAAGAGSSVGASRVTSEDGRPPPPTVTGPRETTSQRPTFTFRSAGATRFRCSFDSPRLHSCPARYSQRLRPGRHVLRARAVSATGTVSRLTTVVVVVRSPLPALPIAAATRVGAGAGVPAVDSGAVWVPNTKDGTLSKVDSSTNSVTATIRIGSPLPAGETGFLDSAVASDGSVWVSRDFAREVVRVAAATNTVAARIPVAERPGGLTSGGGFVWAFHFLGPTITRIDPRTDSTRTFTVAGAAATGIAYGDEALWLLTVTPTRLIKVDPETGSVLARITIAPPGVPKRGFIEAWWLTFAEGSLWLTNPNHDLVTRVISSSMKVGAYVRVPLELPFSVSASGNSAWVAGKAGVVRIDRATNRPVAATKLPSADTAFMQVVSGGGAVWVTNYDRGELYRIAAG